MIRFFILVFCLIIGQWSIAQKINKADVPAGVMKTFISRMPDTLPVTWEKKDANYIAHFTKNKLNASIQISDKADWLTTKWDIPSEYLPKKVKDYISEKYAGYKTVYAKLEYKPGGEFYLVSIKMKKEKPVLRFSVKAEFIGVEPVATPEKIKDK
jgi:hypothetical protein